MIRPITSIVRRTAVALAATPVLAQPCTPHWSTEFPGGDLSAPARAMIEFDDGSGPALYVGGDFWSAAGVEARSVARWDGSAWSAVGNNPPGWVTTFAARTDPPRLYADVFWGSAGAGVHWNIASWDGLTWALLPGEFNLYHTSLRVFDSGAGSDLYAGGAFTEVDGAPVPRIARWDGTTWHDLAGGLGGSNAYVLDLEVFDDGSGLALFVAGSFTLAGTLPVNGFVKWDGRQWLPVPAPPLAPGQTGVLALEVFDDGDGPELYAGGLFTAGGTGCLARYSPSGWTLVRGAPTSGAFRMRTIRTGSAARLWVAGAVSWGSPNWIEIWDGWSWSHVGDAEGSVYGLEGFSKDGRAHVAGDFTSVSGVTTARIAAWTGSKWSPLSLAPHTLNAPVNALLTGGSVGPDAVVVGGGFTDAAGVPANRVARYDGTTWTSLGAGIPGGTHSGGQGGTVLALAEFDDGTGPAIYAGGAFAFGGSALARWNGSTWTGAGGGVWCSAFDCQGYVSDMEVFDDGAGDALFVAGFFHSLGGWFAMPAGGIGRWNGTTWDNLAGGFSFPGPIGSFAVEGTALAVHDGGSGPALYVGGRFAMAGGLATPNIALWNHGEWSPVGPGLPGPVFALATHDPGSGARLYAARGVPIEPGVFDGRVAAWDGAGWSDIGGVFDEPVRALAVFDEGQGAGLHAGGAFGAIDGQPLRRLARLEGPGWTEMGGGVGLGSVSALHPLTNGSLLIGGQFHSVGNAVSSAYMARRVGCAACYADCDGSGALTVADFGCFQTRFAAGEPYADCTGDGALTVADFGCFQTRFVAGCP